MTHPIDINAALRVVELALTSSHNSIVRIGDVNMPDDGNHRRIDNYQPLVALDAIKKYLASGAGSEFAGKEGKRDADIEFVMESGKTMKVYIRG